MSKRAVPDNCAAAPDAKRCKTTKDSFVAYMNAVINAMHQSADMHTARDKELEAIRAQFGAEIHTVRMSCSPHGQGWKVDPTSVAYIRQFCADTLTLTEVPLGAAAVVTDDTPAVEKAVIEFLLGEHAETGLSRLRDRIGTSAECVPYVWFEEMTDPLTVWQVLHITQNADARSAIEAFYSRFGSYWFDVAGMFYVNRSRWLHQLTKEYVNKLCVALQHAPVFKALPAAATVK